MQQTEAEVNSGSFPAPPAAQVRNTCNYRTDGERGDMPGKEELPILRLDAPVHRPLPRRHFLSDLLCNLFFLPHSLFFFFYSSSSAFIPFFSARPFLLRHRTRDALPCDESTPECRGAPNHVLAWPLSKLMFYGCRALPAPRLLKGPRPS